MRRHPSPPPRPQGRHLVVEPGGQAAQCFGRRPQQLGHEPIGPLPLALEVQVTGRRDASTRALNVAVFGAVTECSESADQVPPLSTPDPPNYV
jgi:hypothetical protein